MTLALVVLCGFAALVVSAVATGPILNGLAAIKSRQTVSQHLEEHAHKQGTPTMGGLIVLAGLTAVAAASMAFTQDTWALPGLVLVAVFGLIGFVDDYVVPRKLKGKRGLGWKQKLILQIGGCALAMVLAGITHPVAIAMGAFVVLFFSNAYNFADGMDGLAGTLAMVICGCAGAMALSVGDLATFAWLAMLAGSMVPFLWVNAPPAKVFMGDVGALPIGALLGWVWLELWRQGPSDLSVVGPLIVLAGVMIVELVPVPLQILSVKLRGGKRLFPRTPIHHAFQHAGWPETRVVAMFVLVQLVLGAAALAWWSLQGPGGAA